MRHNSCPLAEFEADMAAGRVSAGEVAEWYGCSRSQAARLLKARRIVAGDRVGFSDDPNPEVTSVVLSLGLPGIINVMRLDSGDIHQMETCHVTVRETP